MKRSNELSRLSCPAADVLPPDPVRLAASAYLTRFTGSSRKHTESDLRCYLRRRADRGLPGCSAACQDVVMRISAGSSRSHAAPGSILSIGSSGSILSIGSSGPILSIGSAGSILSVGSVGSLASAFPIGSAASAGSILSALSRWSILAWRSRGHVPRPRRQR
jgi:hypothetical protein